MRNSRHVVLFRPPLRPSLPRPSPFLLLHSCAHLATVARLSNNAPPRLRPGTPMPEPVLIPTTTRILNRVKPFVLPVFLWILVGSIALETESMQTAKEQYVKTALRKRVELEEEIGRLKRVVRELEGVDEEQGGDVVGGGVESDGARRKRSLVVW
ncbi:hypothetical protein HK104_009296 [Borealophlyctis nickersoniae]|nr:hypothetical protein HK104_009296 [Borealophlyctis nickersoniae]